MSVKRRRRRGGGGDNDVRLCFLVAFSCRAMETERAGGRGKKRDSVQSLSMMHPSLPAHISDALARVTVIPMGTAAGAAIATKYRDSIE